jgi:hypothetical protein
MAGEMENPFRKVLTARNDYCFTGPVTYHVFHLVPGQSQKYFKPRSKITEKGQFEAGRANARGYWHQIEQEDTHGA